MKPIAIYFDLLQYQQANLELMKRHFDVLIFPSPAVCPVEALEKAILVFAPLEFQFDEAFFSQCKRLRVIASNTTGIPHIDAKAAADRGIAVCALHDDQQFLETITPTAECTIGLMIAAVRRIPAAHQATTSQGVWERRPWGAPRMLSRMRLGIIGFGRLGRKVGAIAEAMGMRVSFYDPARQGSVADLLQLASLSDVLSLHAPALSDTYHLVNRQVLSAMPKNGVVVNTARGELLDTDALLDLLESRHLWAAALDTIEGEYSAEFHDSFSRSRLIDYARTHENLIITPHIGGSTVDAWFETEHRVISRACLALGIFVDGT